MVAMVARIPEFIQDSRRSCTKFAKLAVLFISLPIATGVRMPELLRVAPLAGFAFGNPCGLESSLADFGRLGVRTSS